MNTPSVRQTDTKTALMDSAERAVRARGFDGFSYADLARAIGIRKASIHYHFPTKANLSEALMDRYHATFDAFCARIDAAHDTGGHRLAALIDFYRSALNDGRTLCLCVAFTGSRESLSEPLTAKVAAFRKAVIDWLTTVYEQAARDQTIARVSNPHLEARATLALLEGAQIAARAEEDAAIFDQTIALLSARLNPLDAGTCTPK